MANRTIYIDNLEVEQIQRFDHNDIEVLTPNEVLAQSLDETDALIVLCELNIDKDDKKVKRTAFYGVKLVQELRRQKFMGKVLFVSFLDRSYFLKNLLKYKIISLEAGHSFVKLPASLDEIKTKVSNIEKLDHLSFRDTYLFATGISGTVQEEIHRLSSLKENYKSEHIKLIKDVCDFFNEEKVELLKRYELITDDFLKSIGFLETETKNILEKYIKGGFSSIYKPKYSWSILWLDDEIGEKYNQGLTVPIVEYLEQEVGIKIIKATTFEDAEEIYTKDSRVNAIRVVIADYRLHYIDEQGYLLQNSLQGYHFIEHIIKEDDTMALFAYSGLPRRFLMETFSHYGKKIQSFSKKDFPIDKKEVFGYISDAIVSQGDDAWIEINNQPTATAWEDMSETYFEFKSGFDFSIWNKQINTETTKRVALYKKGDLCNLNMSTTEFDKEKKASKKTKLSRLKKILPIRRLAICMMAEEYAAGNDMIKAKKVIAEYIFMSSGKIPNKKTPDTIFNRLALEVTSFPMFLLPEENTWLEFDSGLNFNVKKKIDNYWVSINYIKNKVKKFYSESKFFQSQLQNFSINDFSKPFAFTEDFEPNLKISDDVRRLFLFLRSNLKESENLGKDFGHFISLWRSILSYVSSSNEMHINIESLNYTLQNLEPFDSNTENEINGSMANLEKEPFIEALNSVVLLLSRTTSLIDEEKRITRNSFTSLLKNYYISITCVLYRNTLRVVFNRIFLAIKNNDPSELVKIQNLIQNLVDSDSIQKDCVVIANKLSQKHKPLKHNIEEEYFFLVAPWEKIHNKKTRLQSDFNQRSNKLKDAIFNKDLEYLDDAIYNKELFQIVLTNFISSKGNRKSIFQYAIDFRKQQTKESLLRSNTDSKDKNGTEGNSISSIENAENINARKNLDEEFDYDEFLNSEGLGID
jgi:hypothetical protein